jgi:hypothetical protein
LTSEASKYAAGFLEESLGLASGSLQPGQVPGSLVDELSAVLRGAPPTDSSAPSLETRIKDILETLERSSLKEKGYFVRKARWPDAAPFAVCLTHDVDNIERPMEHVLKIRDRFDKADLQKAMDGKLSLYDNI